MMAQLNVYVPDELEEKIKKEAKRAGKSVSAFMVDAVRTQVDPKRWSAEFLSTFGSWEGEFPEIKDAPLQKRRGLGKL